MSTLINNFYKKSKYGKLQEQAKKCAIKNCSIKEKEMNEAFDNANNYYKEEEEEEKKGKGFLKYFKWLKV